MSVKKAAFLFTIDLELMWGFNGSLIERPWLLHTPNFRRYVNNMLRARDIAEELIRLAERFEVPITWAIVGHLLLDKCERKGDVPHPDMPRPKTTSGLDWYAFDPCTGLAKDPLWYGKDIVEAILDSDVEHELGCHSFSHVNFRACSREVAEAEVEKCVSLMEEIGVRPLSFVFPYDRVGHLDVLAKHGFKAFRSPLKSWVWPLQEPERLKGFLMNVIEAPLRKRLGLPPPIMRPRRRGALVELPSLCPLYAPSEVGPLSLMRGILKAIHIAHRRGALIHVYSHLHNLAQDKAYLRAVVFLFNIIGSLREQGLMDVLTMREAARLAR